jgi:hypothetical protein
MEFVIQMVAGIKLLFIATCSMLYALGGMYGTWIRRYMMPIVAAAGVWLTSYIFEDFNFLYLLWPILLCFALHIGYGGDTTWEKVMKRAIYGLAIGATAIPLAILTGGWLILAVHMPLMVVASIIFGVFNPFEHARYEETVLGFLSVCLPMFMV